MSDNKNDTANKNKLKKLNIKQLAILSEILGTIKLVLNHSSAPHIIYIPFENFSKDIERNIVLKWIEELVKIKVLEGGGRVVGKNVSEQEIEIRISDDKKDFLSFLDAVKNKSGKIKNIELKTDKEKEEIFDGKISTPIGTFNWRAFFKRFNGPYRVVPVVVLLIICSFIYYFLFYNHSSFSYTMQGRAFGPENINNPLIIKFRYEGIIRSTFNDKRALERINYDFWKDKNIGTTYGGGYMMGDIYDLGSTEGKKKIKLPILFEPNESKHIEIYFTVNAQNEEELKKEFQHICEGVFCRYESNIELSFQDSRGNLFDEGGKIISENVMNSWWVFPNNRTKPRKVVAYLDIFKDMVVWKIQRWFHVYR